MRKITADYIFPVSTDPIKKGVLVINEIGEILEIGDRSDYRKDELEYYDGIIIPGFINTHCHLELSHMFGLVNTGTGLIDFISNIVKYRDFEIEQIKEAIADQDKKMWDAGIMAVGDISNTDHTTDTKSKSKIAYYTFVEMFDFMQSSMTKSTIEQYTKVYDAHQTQKSFVPHAPYTVTPQLFEFIKNNNKAASTISIHNQETLDENKLFLDKTGGFLDFYKGFGMELNEFKAKSKPSIHYAIEHMDPDQRSLFVHNTMSTKEDISAAQEWSNKSYWATCPNANLYIENKLPDYKQFIEMDAKMTIGTDSLSSNWQLSILEEIKTIQKYKSYIDFNTLLRWATLNGAEALGMSDKLGSLEVGKSPGILQLKVQGSNDEIKIVKDTTVHRII